VRRLNYRLPIKRADIIYKTVEPSKTLRGRIGEKLYFVRVGCVSFYGETLRAERLDLPQGVLRGALIRAVRNRNPNALARQT
jgi:hypothetical protein